MLQVMERIAPHTVQDMKPESTEEIPVLRTSSRIKFHMKQDYIPSMTKSKYAVDVSQFEVYGALHPEAYMIFMKIQ